MRFLSPALFSIFSSLIVGRVFLFFFPFSPFKYFISVFCPILFCTFFKNLINFYKRLKPLKNIFLPSRNYPFDVLGADADTCIHVAGVIPILAIFTGVFVVGICILNVYSETLEVPLYTKHVLSAKNKSSLFDPYSRQPERREGRRYVRDRF